jgi:hypothetical protein
VRASADQSTSCAAQTWAAIFFDTGEDDQHQQQAQPVVGLGQGMGLLAGDRGVAGQFFGHA